MRKPLPFVILFLTVTLVHGQTTPALLQSAPGVGLAYRTEAATHEVDLGLNRRERTLLGDLDLSGAWGGPTYNYTATGDDWSLVRGGFGGLEFGRDVFIGYGGWNARELFTADESSITFTDPNNQPISPQYDFRSGGFIIAYSPGADNLVHPRFTAIVGPGRINIEDDRLGDDFNGMRDRFLSGQIMAGAELNIFQWFRLGLEGGYRFASGVDLDGIITSSDVSGAVLQIEARFGWSWD